MFKVGDRVKVVGHKGLSRDYDIEGTEGVIEKIVVDEDYAVMKCDNGFQRFGCISDFKVTLTTPPQKIQQNGYEYELVGPVKPKWLVDGVWVVNVHDGGKRLVKEVAPGVFNLKVNDLVSIRYHEGIRDQYLPHTDKDWK